MLIVCNGMIRSGSTLQYNMIRMLIDELGAGQAEGFFEKDDVDSSKLMFSEWEEDSKFHIIKMHEMYPFMPEENREEKVCVLYIYRDIRDVAVSAKRKFGLQGNDLIGALDRAIYLSDKIKNLPNVLCQRYEDVFININEGIKEQAIFFGLSVSDQVIEKISKKCSIHSAISNTQKSQRDWKMNVRKFLRTLRFPVTWYDKDTLLHPDHISDNKGMVGVWEFSLSEEEKSMINNKYYNWLIANNYKI